MKFAVTGFISIMSKHAPEPEIEHPGASWNLAALKFFEKSEFNHPSSKELTTLTVNSSSHLKSCTAMKFAVTGLISVLSKHAELTLELNTPEHSGARLVWVSLLKWSQLYSQIPTSSPAPPDLSLKCEWKYLQTEVSIQSNICAEMFCKSHKFVKAKYRRSWSGEYGGLAG